MIKIAPSAAADADATAVAEKDIESPHLQEKAADDARSDANIGSLPRTWRIWPLIGLIVFFVGLPMVLYSRNGFTIFKCGDKGTTVQSNPAEKEDLCDPSDWSCFNLSEVASDAVTGIATLHKGLGVPDHLKSSVQPVLQEGDFDVSTYFDVLKHVYLAEGDTLDYIYHNNGMSGYPQLYVRSEDEEPLLTSADYELAKQEDDYRLWHDLLLTDDSSAGYLELVILGIMGRHFYLFQADYRDTKLVWNLNMAEDLIQIYNVSDEYEEEECRRTGCFASDALEVAKNIEWEPKVEKTGGGESTVSVSVMVFSKYGGFTRRHYSIAREDSNFTIRFLDMTEENLIKYPVGLIL